MQHSCVNGSLAHYKVINNTSNILKHILVAIDLGGCTHLVIKQAIELSAGVNTTIHLLHVYQPGKAMAGSKTASSNDPGKLDIEKKMGQWRECLQEALPDCKVKGYILHGAVHENILLAARSIKPQLIIVGKPAKSNFFSFYKPLDADELSLSSKCPVLTVVHGGVSQKIKTIILPVRHFIPLRKLELLAFFAKVYRAKILIVAQRSRVFIHAKEREVLMETYQLLVNRLNNKVEYQLLEGSNFPRAVADCATAESADMLIVNPAKETRVSGFFRTGINDILPGNSRLKILSVVPYQDM